ncbi:hypothetical protein PHYSODRAFT_330667 [Phytophthora sojae]|uniref:Uncharacterized protein n=1 Tax=Phytophthora sojae (strain P6497) TaxID=1094619 RepID=G4ZF99_PHYSP|nr:hypothetical protein PHYSODRAFT_330667 [Phytophthora sojae]EGZ16602.1 hypothetical protein PHYSODRAFT_330667 [Phytophthora sojae]|eukprot:XP_009525660.1 hypothetical protein PHYSODRAFT_330667 [Phytophthora sojae]
MSTDRIATEQEFSKLEMLLVQTADDAVNCLKMLKGNIADYDSRHGLRFISTSKAFLRGDIRAAKDTTAEITVARSAMNATSDVMNDLAAAGRAYDENNLKSRGITGAVTDMLSGGNNKGQKKKKGKGNQSVEDPKRVGSERILRAPDTVEEVVESTLRDCFSGFSALKLQVSVAEESLSPLFAERSNGSVASDAP